MNLFWLKYVSYLFLAGAVLWYFLIRLNKVMMFRRSLAVGLCGGCVALACIAYYIQEANAERNSPRQLIMGRVISVSEDRSRSGNISDQFQLQLGNAKLSPKFSTGRRGNQRVRTAGSPGATSLAFSIEPGTVCP